MRVERSEGKKNDGEGKGGLKEFSKNLTTDAPPGWINVGVIGNEGKERSEKGKRWRGKGRLEGGFLNLTTDAPSGWINVGDVLHVKENPCFRKKVEKKILVSVLLTRTVIGNEGREVRGEKKESGGGEA
ncbi:hypothetical protein CEXT_32651 [Caerostris extrusa]|uniref:Uncharacterized protein n=1 Tax=Caerostris extrusa TaxID=172846 RepID=A0AAV4SGQ5_CAEEX|nr:hypothetical protein CEXT_32651 [Caerostris extrusa]